MSKTVACIIARTVSTRLPLKVLRDITPGVSMIQFIIQRLKLVKGIDEIYLCTSTESVDDIFEDISKNNGIKVFRGGTDDVIQRMISVGELEKADALIRVTGDNPLCSIEYIEKQIDFLYQKNLDYVRVVNIPIGCTAELISFSALAHCYKNMDKSVSEYLMLFLFEPNTYKCGILIPSEIGDSSNYSCTVDTPDDLIRTRMLLNFFNGEALNISTKEIISIYRSVGQNLPALEMKSNGQVKMPYGKLISFEEFNEDMQRRKESSLQITLND